MMPMTYLQAKDALVKAKCETCHGLETISDAEPGDIWHRTIKCPTCKGTGLSKSVDEIINSGIVTTIHDISVNKADAKSKLCMIHDMCDHVLGHNK